VVVVNSDYSSTSVSLTDQEGRVLSPLTLSSASQATGLNAALSGDVVVPTMPASGGESILIDRSHGVVSVLDIARGTLRSQLDVASGFAANPQDIVVAGDRAYVSRFGSNLAAGSQAFDAGDDLLVVDLAVPAVLGRVSLTEALGSASSNYRPGATRAVLAKGKVRVALTGFTFDFSDALAARFSTVDPASDSLTHTLVVPEVRNCVALAVAPDGNELAAACSGVFVQDPVLGWPDAGVLRIGVGETGLELKSVWPSKRFLSCSSATNCQPSQPAAVAYAGPDVLLVTTFGRLVDGASQGFPGQVFALDITNDKVERLFEAGAFDLGSPVCTPASCLVPDAGAGGLWRFGLPLKKEYPTLEVVDTSTGLPPRFLQRF
jgi:hypothetical protein